MPRDKFMNHKGQCRQFTPIDELQRELEENLNLTPNGFNTNGKQVFIKEQQENVDVNVKSKKMGGAVAGLIAISNPNRSKNKSLKYSLFTQEINDRNKLRVSQNEKSASEANADLARLAIVRKKREAAAELRLAAKKEFYQNASGSTISKSDISLKKKNLQTKSKGLGAKVFKNNDEDEPTKNDNMKDIIM